MAVVEQPATSWGESLPLICLLRKTLLDLKNSQSEKVAENALVKRKKQRFARILKAFKRVY